MGSTVTDIVVPKLDLLKFPEFSADVLKTFGGRPLWKVDEKTHTVYGLSTAEVPDADNEKASYPDSKRNYLKWGDATAAITSAAGQAISRGNIRYQHTTQIAGKVLQMDFLDDKRQIWLLTQPVDDKIWEQLAGGFLTGYSHAGRYEYRRCDHCGYDLPAGNYCPQCHQEECALYAPILSEVSYVDRPCLGIATFAYVKSDGSTELRKFVAPAAKKVLVDLGELASLFTANFMKAVGDLGKSGGVSTATGLNFYQQVGQEKPKCPHCGSANVQMVSTQTHRCEACGRNWESGKEARARNPVGQFVNNASGPAHEALVAHGYEHTRTGSTRDGAAEPVSSRCYRHAGGASLTLCEDGRWSHEDGKGRTTTGTGVDSLTSHLAACHAKKADAAPAAGKDTRTMEDAAVQKLVSDQVAAAVAEAMKFNKAVKYLVTEDDGTQHLPYTDESGKPDHKLMGAAWAALHGGFRGKKYEGPDKQKAIERLKSVYEKEGMKPPEKMAAMALQMEDLRKRMADAIDKRTDSLRKDMSQVGRLADILQGIRWLQQSSFWEGQMEQDDRDFAIADRLGDWLQEGVNILNVIVMDETSELTASLEAPALKTAAIHNEGEVDMNATELLNKAAKGLKAHFGKAAAFHEHKAACHKAASTSHADLAEAHKAMMEFHSKTKKADGGDEEEKSFHKASHAFHKASHTHHVDKASHHEKLHKAHSTMCDACKAAAESVGNEEAKADGAGDMTKALGDTQAALEAKLEPITKALAALEKLESLTKAVETLQADVTKMGNETLPTLVKGSGSPQLIGRDGQNLTPPAAGADPGNLL